MSDGQPGTHIFDDKALAELCLDATTRLGRALDSGDKPAAEKCFDELAAAKRGFPEGFLDWLVLTGEYVLETMGHEDHVRATRPERLVELAARGGFGLEDLVKAQELMTGSGDTDLERSVRDAIAQGDRKGALEGWGECERLFRAVHDFRRDAISDALGHIYVEYGVDCLRDAQLFAAARGPWDKMFRAEVEMGPEQRMRAFAFMMGVGSYSRMSIKEENDRWVVRMHQCGTCGRQVNDRYRNDGWQLKAVSETGPITLAGPALTVYQTHLAVIHQMFAIDTVGAPWPVIECSGLAADTCHCDLLIYKDPAATPERFFERVGMTKPAA